MERFLRDNFVVRTDENGEDIVVYEGENGNQRTTLLSMMVDHPQLYSNVFDFWRSQGLQVPQ